MSTSRLPAAISAASAMFLVGTLAAVSAVIADYPVYGGQAIRYGAAAVILLAIARSRRLTPVRLTRRDLLFVALLAAVGLVLFNVCLIEATRHASPAAVGTVVGSVPIALAIAGPLLTGTATGNRRPSSRVVAAALVITAGAGLTTGLGNGGLLGLAWALGALACEVGFSLLAMPILPRLGAIRVSAYSTVAAVPILLLVGLGSDGAAMLRAPTEAEVTGLAYLATVVSVGAFIVWYSALPRLGPDRAGLFAGLVPVGAIVTTVVLGLGVPTVTDLAGAILVVLGITLGLSGTADRKARAHQGLRASAGQPVAVPAR